MFSKYKAPFLKKSLSPAHVAVVVVAAVASNEALEQKKIHTLSLAFSGWGNFRGPKLNLKAFFL